MEPVLREIRLQNVLSFGPDTPPLALKPLNVLIGPNGSGKSNLLEAIGLLHAAPKNLSAGMRESGGVLEWLWQGEQNPTATVEAKIHDPGQPDAPWLHSFSFAERSRSFFLTAERIEKPGTDKPVYCYGGGKFQIQVHEDPARKQVPRPSISTEESILSQRKDPERYPVLSYLCDLYSRFRMYREWSFGRSTPPRQPQRAD
ncbi:MAG TPA: AAA family ATPase, partial [Planctomycetota bacterium]|nr:AAA family ATPase [Planctomycetota bacterium]